MAGSSSIASPMVINSLQVVVSNNTLPNERVRLAYDSPVRNTAELREEILGAARAEFAQYGLAGARIGRTARTAQASKERFYAHFGDKETLFREVLAADSSEFFRAI